MTDKKTSEWEDVPKDVGQWEDVSTSAPTLGQEFYAGAYGLGKGIAAIPGETERLVTQELPKMLPGRPRPPMPAKKDLSLIQPGKTLFPTTSEVEQAATKIGIPRPAKGTEASETLGELAPAIAGGAQLAKTLGTYGIGKASDLANRLLGTRAKKEAEQASRKIETAIPQYTREAERDIERRAATETQAEYEKRARQQANLREAEKKAVSAAQQEREAAARKFSDLGTPSDTAKLGDDMQRRLTGTEFTRGARRSQRAAEDAKNYYIQARERGNFVDSDQGKSFLNYLKSQMFSQRVTPAERKIAEQMYVDLEAAKDIEAVEKTFRKYQELSKGAPKEGYDAVLQQYAGRVSDNLSEALNIFSPKRKEFRDTYRELSGPLDAYETAFGAKGVAMETAVPERVKMMPTDYPKTYFKNRDTINALREQLAGDEAAVRKFANQHTVNELQGKTASQAADWLKTNGEWLNTVEGLNVRVNRYVSELQRAEASAAAKEAQATKLGEKAKEIGTTRETAQEKIATTAASQKEKLSSFREQLNLSPEKAPALANNMIKYLSDNKLMSPERLRLLKADVDAAEKATDAVKRAEQIRRAFIKWGVITAGGTYATYEFGKSLFNKNPF